MMASQELIYMITKKNNSFLRKNLTQTFTSDLFSLSNIPRACDLGFVRRNARGLQRNPNGQVTVLKQTTRRTICKNKKRRGVTQTVSTKTVVDASKTRARRCRLLNLRRLALVQASSRVKQE